MMDLITLLLSACGWVLIGLLAYRIYREQEENPKVWRIVVALVVGLFAFSINLTVFGQQVKLAILPLGVWLVYGFLRKGRWHVYRRFVWLGFKGNYIFLALALSGMLLHAAIYQKDEPATYIANIEEASLVGIHPSAGEYSLDREALRNQLPRLKQKPVDSQGWYMQIYDELESGEHDERFPYQIVGALPEWGSGIHARIYIEQDGKGLLVTTQNKQYYFRSDVSLLKGEE